MSLICEKFDDAIARGDKTLRFKDDGDWSAQGGRKKTEDFDIRATIDGVEYKAVVTEEGDWVIATFPVLMKRPCTTCL